MARKTQAVYVEGFDELNKALRSVGNRAGGLVLRNAAEAGAKVIVDEAQRLAPKKSGKLAASIRAVVGRLQAGRVQVNISYGKDAWYGGLVELGHALRRKRRGKEYGHVPPKPYLRPALDGKAEEAKDAVAASLRASLRDVLD